MPDVSFSGLAVVSAVAFGAPLVLGLAPGVRLPAVVLELVAGIVIGPAALGWVELDVALELFSLVGLAFLLLIAGMEIDFERLRGRLLEVTGLGFLVSFAIALAIGFALDAADVVQSPLLLAIMLSATSLGVVIPVLKDAGQISSQFGQLVIAGASIADVLTIVLLSLFFSGESTGTATRVILLGSFALLCGAVALALAGVGRSNRLSAALLRLQDTTAQIRVRGAFLLLAVFVVLAERFGVEAILGAFMAGAVLKLVDRDRMMTHPHFREKLEAVGFGVFVPFAGQIGMDLGVISEATGAALIAAGLLSVLAFPLSALVVLRGSERARAPETGDAATGAPAR